jgi:hypothetical protein
MKQLIAILFIATLMSCAASKPTVSTPNSGTGGNNKPVTVNQK